MEIPDWRKYSADKFIGRAKIIEKIRAWLRTAERQVLALIGPPGGGKTWLLKRLEDELKGAGGSIFVVYLNAPSLIDRKAAKAEKVIDRFEADKWIKGIYDQARARGYVVPDYDPALTPVASVQRLVDALCQENGLLQVVVLVDGYDEVESNDPEPSRRIFTYAFADRILVPLLQRRCVRLVIAHRGATGLQHPGLSPHDRYAITEYDAEDPIPPYQQYLRFCASPADPEGSPASGLFNAQEFAAWQGQLQQYRWDNPFINNYLFFAAVVIPGGGLSPLSVADLGNCIRDLIEKVDGNQSSFPRLSVANFLILREIARLKPEFTREDLFNHNIPITIFDPNFRMFIDVYGVILQVPHSARYTMLDSLRGLFRDLDSLENKR